MVDECSMSGYGEDGRDDVGLEAVKPTGRTGTGPTCSNGLRRFMSALAQAINGIQLKPEPNRAPIRHLVLIGCKN